jgi:hypothetical protein
MRHIHQPPATNPLLREAARVRDGKNNVLDTLSKDCAVLKKLFRLEAA